MSQAKPRLSRLRVQEREVELWPLTMHLTTFTKSQTTHLPFLLRLNLRYIFTTLKAMICRSVTDTIGPFLKRMEMEGLAGHSGIFCTERCSVHSGYDANSLIEATYFDRALD